jgi:hypothetical protein
VHPDAAERTTAIAKRYEGTEREDVAFRLRESERALRQAIRNVNASAKSLA